ncbi:MAG: hypothetical protein PHX21_12740 [bacterium]|nr:hypothetical protein [bacterium]
MKSLGAVVAVFLIGVATGCIITTGIDVSRVYPILQEQDFSKGYDVGYRMAFVCQGLSPLNIVEYEIVRDTVIEHKDNKDVYLSAQTVWYGLMKDKYFPYDVDLRDTIIKNKGKRPDTLQFMGKGSELPPDSAKPKTKHKHSNKKAPKAS